MLLAFGTTPARRAVLAVEVLPLPVQLVALHWSTTRPTIHLRVQRQRKPRLRLVPLLCQRVLRQLPLRPKLLSLPKTQKAFGTTPAAQVVRAALAVPLLAQNAARPWRTTRRITSKKTGFVKWAGGHSSQSKTVVQLLGRPFFYQKFIQIFPSNHFHQLNRNHARLRGQGDKINPGRQRIAIVGKPIPKDVKLSIAVQRFHVELFDQSPLRIVD